MISEFLTRGTAAGNLSATQTAQTGQQFLRFHLLPDTTAMLPVQQITEVLTISIAQVVPIPHMPAEVMGIYNWRGEILWLVDLGQLLGLASYQQLNSRSHYTTIVIHNSHQVSGKQQTSNQKTGKKMLGLLISRVEDMEWCNPDLIQSPPVSAVTPNLVPFLRGYWSKSNSEILVVLDGDSIIAGMPQPQVAETI